MLIYKYLFIFSIFSVIGWILEFIYRGIKSKKIVNPGFMSGCVVPLYGMGAIILDFLCRIIIKYNFKYEILIMFIISLILLTLLELMCGIICVNFFNVRLWDYSKRKLNYKGHICLQFSIIWGLAGLFYYCFCFNYVDNLINSFTNSINMIFLLGIFIGIFIVDLSVSIKLFNRIIYYSKEIKENINIEKIKLEARLNYNRKKFLNSIYPYISTNKYIKEKIKELKK